MNNNCDVPAFAFCVTALPARLLWRTFSAEFAFRGVCLVKVSVRGKQKCYLLHVRYSAYHGLWMRAVVSVPCNRDEVPSTSLHQDKLWHSTAYPITSELYQALHYGHL